MTTADYFHRTGEAHLVPIPYRGCGLDEIYLCNGYERDQLDDGEWYTTVTDREGLHKAIALHLVQHRKVLEPREIKFIRRTMEMSQADLGKLLRTGYQTVARWEKGKTEMPGVSDLLLRLVLLAYLLPADRLAEVAKRLPVDLEELDDGQLEPVRFRHDEHWLEAA